MSGDAHVDLPVERIPTLVAGVATLLLGVVVVTMSPRSPLHRAFGLFSGLRGGMLSLHALSGQVDSLQGRLSVYLLLGIPFAALWLAHVFLHRIGYRRRPLRKEVGWALILAAALVEAAYLARHGLFYRGPLGVFFPLQFAAYAFVALAAAKAFLHAEDGPTRRALYVFALAFAAEPTYAAAALLSNPVFVVPTTALGATYVAVVALAGVLVVATASLMFRAARFDSSRFLSVQAAAAATGVLTTVTQRMQIDLAGLPTVFIFNAGWTLFLVVVATYAIVRYRFFTIDIRVKAFIRHGSAALVLGPLFVVLSAMLEDRIQAQGLGSVVAAVLIALALFPVERLTKRLADRLMPGVADTQAYRAQRRLDIYRAALREAWRDGYVSPDEKAALDALWKSLGIGGKQAQELEREVGRAHAAGPA